MSMRLRSLATLGATAMALTATIAAPAPATLAHAVSAPPLAVLVAPAVPLAVSAATARGVFLERQIVTTLPAGPLTVAAAPDGREPLCVDDEARLVITGTDGTVAVWAHRFFTANRQQIACVPPPTLPALTQAGTYTVTLTLTDRFAPTYRATPFYLVAGDVALAAPTALAEATAAPTPVPSPAPTLVPSPAPTPVSTVQAAPEPASAQPSMPIWLWGVSVGGVALLVLVLLRLRQRPRPVTTAQAGVLTLADRATHETRTVILVAGRPQALHRRPLGLVPPDQSVPALAQVQLTAGGLVVRTPDGGVHTLGHATTFALADGTVTVRYRAHGVAPQAAHPITKGRC